MCQLNQLSSSELIGAGIAAGQDSFLIKYKIPYQWIDIDMDKRAEQIVLDVNQGFRSIPTILFEDGSTLVEPSNSTLAAKLGLRN